MPKRKKVDVPTVQTTLGEEKVVMFGWCSTGHHDGCVVSFPGHKCKCDCHGKEENSDE